MRIRTLVGSMLASGLLLAAVVPALAHAQTSAPTRASAASAPTGAPAASHPTPASHPTRVDRQLQRLRRATAQFHSIAVAEQKGYGLLVDVNKIACIDMPAMPGMPAAAMGVHWAKSALVGDGKIRLTEPEAMVYAPGRDGTLSLGAVEYVVLKADWDAKHHHAPVLFGQKFNTTDSPNRFGLPAFYSLHVWVWKHNPAGTFAMFNPDVMCPA